MHCHSSRRRVLAQASTCGAALALPAAVRAQSADWPAQPVRIIVPFAAGGATDVLTRLIARGIGARVGQPLVVDNRGGAGGIPGTDAVAKAAPDGTTFGTTTLTQLVSNQILYAKLPYDVERELSLVSLIATVPLVLCVHPGVQAATAPELLAHLKAHPGKYSYGSYGTGNFGHLAAMHLSASQGANMVHAPYRGESPMLQDLLGGQIQMAFASVQSARPHAEAGRLRIVGITGTERVKAMAGVPTLAEQGLADEVYRMNPGWIALIAPKHAPAAVQARMAGKVMAVTRSAEVQEAILNMGFNPVGSTPQEFVAQYQAEFPVWRKLIAQAGVKAE